MLEFCNFGFSGGGDQNIFDFRCGCPMSRDISEGGWFILCPFSHFEMQDFKNSKIFGALIFNIHIFRFKIHAGLQVHIGFNTESKFSCSIV